MRTASPTAVMSSARRGVIAVVPLKVLEAIAASSPYLAVESVESVEPASCPCGERRRGTEVDTRIDDE
ncbi:hypothetical protein GCM10009799_49140 [Nocardiopsis rhodophaea]|uniref:Uncharacterized protein n=1 Tax=Nocardiopsis rhodophaea TaxID=280238 RepID=A0ABN2TN12_9ACTN